jgi:hypothetical protein
MELLQKRKVVQKIEQVEKQKEYTSSSVQGENVNDKGVEREVSDSPIRFGENTLAETQQKKLTTKEITHLKPIFKFIRRNAEGKSNKAK